VSAEFNSIEEAWDMLRLFEACLERKGTVEIEPVRDSEPEAEAEAR
jgi:hypothetical protein